MTEEMRMESDSIGTMEVPKEAYYGVQALRAKQNFPITGQSLHPVFIRNLAKVKKAAAQSNRNALALPADKAEAIIRACDEVIRGCFTDEFIVDAIQGGAGTSANMNMNEVLANRANEWMGGRKGDYSRIHPNDHVNMSQSTNDVIPTAGKLTVLEQLKPLLAELDGLERELRIKAAEFDGILKMGRTQLQDAVPMLSGKNCPNLFFSALLEHSAHAVISLTIARHSCLGYRKKRPLLLFRTNNVPFFSFPRFAKYSASIKRPKTDSVSSSVQIYSTST